MRKRKTMKRFVGLIMAAALIIGMFPFAAFADDASDMPDAVDGKITLSSDVTLTNEFVVNEGESVTIDLAGHTITNASGKNTIVNKGTLVIRDSGTGGNIINNASGYSVLQNEPGATATIESGTLHKTNNTDSNDYYAITNHGDMTINGGSIVSESSHSSAIENGWYTASNNTDEVYSTMTINAGDVSNSGTTANGGLYTLKNDDYGIMTINGGTFTNNVADAGTVLNWNDLTINGGTFNAANAAVATMAEGTNGVPTHAYEQGRTTITDGTFTGGLGTNSQYSAITVRVSGGTYSSQILTDYLATGYSCEAIDGGRYKVVTSSTLEADASASNDTANAVVGGSFSGEENSDNVGTTNGTLTITATTGTNGDANDSVSASNVAINNVSLTSVNNATTVQNVELRTDVATLNIDSQAWNAMTLNANGQNVVLSVAKNTGDTSPLTYTVTAKTADDTEVYSASNAAGGITISVPYTEESAPSVFYVGVNGLEDMHATLADDVLSWVAPHFSDYVVLTEGEVAAVTIDGTTTAYTSLSAAITAANDAAAGKTVVVDILGDVTVPTVQNKPENSGALNISRTMTINGNGHTISYTGKATETKNGTTPETGQFINIASTANNVTIQDLTINASDVKHAVQFYQTTGGTLDNVTINGASWTAVQVNGSTGIKLVDCTLNPAETAYANIEYSMGSGVETIPSVSLENVTGNNNGAFIWVDSATVANMKTALNTQDDAVVQAQLQQTIRNTNDYGAAASVTVEWTKDHPSTVTIPSTYQPPYTGKYSYEVTVDKTTNGSISVDKYVTEGDKVTITVTPDKAYMLDALTVTDKNGDEVTLTDNKDGTYTFTMPSSNVKIVATFAEDPNYEEPSEPETPSMPFTDVNEGDWFYDVVQYAYDNGLMTGTSATTFEPNTSTTRGMIVAVLNRLEGGPTAEAAGFTDVNNGDWYADAVNWAASVGIVNGFEDNTFRANDPITREQMAAILYNYADYKGYDVSERADLSSYADADSISSWALDTLEWANAEGLITGMSADTIAPQGQATRAQVAAMFERFLTAEEQ